MNLSDGIIELHSKFRHNDWYAGVEEDEFNRLVLYAKIINYDILSQVPDEIFGKQVVVHFEAYKNASKENFLNKKEDKNLDGDDDLDFLLDELDALEKICGANILGHLFFECHDRENAVTELRNKFPEVFTRLCNLYDKYGFDVIYDEIEL